MLYSGSTVFLAQVIWSWISKWGEDLEIWIMENWFTVEFICMVAWWHKRGRDLRLPQVKEAFSSDERTTPERSQISRSGMCESVWGLERQHGGGGALAAQKITSGLHQEASVPVCSADSGSSADVVIMGIIKLLKIKDCGLTTPTRWLCGCVAVQWPTQLEMWGFLYTMTENPAVNSLHFYLIYRVLASFLWVLFFF